MKHTRKPLALFLALALAVSLFAGVTVTAGAAEETSGYTMVANSGTPSNGDLFIIRNNSTSATDGVNYWQAMNTTYKTGNYNGFAGTNLKYDDSGAITYPTSAADVEALLWVYETDASGYGYLKNYQTGEYIYRYYNHLYLGQPGSTVSNYSAYYKATFTISGTTIYLGTSTSSDDKLYWDSGYKNFAGFTGSTAYAYKVTAPDSGSGGGSTEQNTVKLKEAAALENDKQYMFIATVDSSYYAMSSDNGTDNAKRAAVSVSLSDLTAGSSIADLSKCVWTAEASGDYFKLAQDGKYLYTNGYAALYASAPEEGYYSEYAEHVYWSYDNGVLKNKSNGNTLGYTAGSTNSFNGSGMWDAVIYEVTDAASADVVKDYYSLTFRELNASGDQITLTGNGISDLTVYADSEAVTVSGTAGVYTIESGQSVTFSFTVAEGYTLNSVKYESLGTTGTLIENNGVYSLGNMSNSKTVILDIGFEGSEWSGGTYEIGNAYDLFDFAAKAALYPNIEGKLTADITLTKDWTPIGTYSVPWTGTFDGNGHTISGLRVNGDYTYAGLFGYIDGATIKNLVVKGYVRSGAASASVAGVAAHAKGEVKFVNVGNEAIVYSVNTNAAYYGAGGVLGFIETNSAVSFESCYNKGQVVTRSGWAGGIVSGGNSYYYNVENGYSAQIVLTNCYNLGSVSKTGDAGGYAGGIMGYYQQAVLTNCYNLGAISSASGYATGELAGNKGTDVSIGTNCYGTEQQSGITAAKLGSAYKELGGKAVLSWETEPYAAPTYLTGVTVAANPTKMSYSTTESFNPTGLVLTAAYSDGSTETVNAGDEGLSYALETKGDETAVTIYYNDYRTVVEPVSTTLTGVTVTQIKHAVTVNGDGHVSVACGNRDSANIKDPTVNVDSYQVTTSGNATTITVYDGYLLNLTVSATDGREIKNVTIEPSDSGLTKSSYSTSGSWAYYTSSVTRDIALTVTTAEPDTSFTASGEGTAASPYLITNETELRALATAVNQGRHFAGTYFKLANDIALTGEWTPIGKGNYSTSDYYFAGIFDGGQHTISGLSITTGNNADANGYGLFGFVKGSGDTGNEAVIKNLAVWGEITNVQVGSNAGVHSYYGGVVGMAYGDVTLQYVASHVDITNQFYQAVPEYSNLADSYVGGLVGYAYGYSADEGLFLYHCYADGALKNWNTNEYHRDKSYTWTGGLVGGHYNYNNTNEPILRYSFANNEKIEVSHSSSSHYGDVIVGYMYGNGTFESVSYRSDLYDGDSVGNQTGASAGLTLADGEFKTENGHTVFTWETVEDSGSGETVAPDTSWYSADADTYTLSDAGDLLGFAQLVNAGNSFADKTVKLGADIAVGSGWTTIGTSSKPFSGTFNGQNHSVTLTVANRTTDDYNGLFGCISGATVERVIVKGSIAGGNYTAGIAGCAVSSTIRYCGNEAKIDGYGYMGGIAGYGSATAILACYNKGDLTNTKTTDVYTGGIVGDVVSNGSTSYCYNTGAVTANQATDNYCYTGGIAGLSQTCAIVGSYSTGVITGTAGKGYTGGVVGSTNLYYQKGNGNLYLKTATINAGITGTGVNTGSYAANAAADDPEYIYYFADISELAGKLGSPFNSGYTLKWESGASYSYNIGDAAALEISTKAGLVEFANSIKSGTSYEGKTVKLTADIDLGGTLTVDETAKTYSASGTWSAIGDVNDTVFKGTFDGNGHKIENMVLVNDNSGSMGFFSFLPQGATVKNLTLTGEMYFGYSRSGDNSSAAGAIVGWNQGTIEGCASYVNVRTFNYYMTGGIAGDNTGTIRNCVNHGSVTSSSSGTDRVGGIAGRMEADYERLAGTYGGYGDTILVPSIVGCENRGAITGGYSDGYVGGIVGGVFNDYSYTTNAAGRYMYVTDCSNYGTYDCKYSGGDQGGIVGSDETSRSLVTAKNVDHTLTPAASGDVITVNGTEITVADMQRHATTATYAMSKNGNTVNHEVTGILLSNLVDLLGYDKTVSSLTFTSTDGTGPVTYQNGVFGVTMIAWLVDGGTPGSYSTDNGLRIAQNGGAGSTWLYSPSVGTAAFDGSVISTLILAEGAGLTPPAYGFAAGTNTFAVSGGSGPLYVVVEHEGAFTRLSSAAGKYTADLADGDAIYVVAAGDANMSGLADGGDLDIIAGIALGTWPADDLSYLAADVNGDGVVTLADLLVLSYSLNSGVSLKTLAAGGFRLLDATSLTKTDELKNGGQYIVAVKYNDTYYAVSSNGHNQYTDYPAAVEITVGADGRIAYSDSLDELIWTYASAGKTLKHGDQILTSTTTALYAPAVSDLAANSWLIKNTAWTYDARAHRLTDGGGANLRYSGNANAVFDDDQSFMQVTKYAGGSNSTSVYYSQDAYLFLLDGTGTDTEQTYTVTYVGDYTGTVDNLAWGTTIDLPVCGDEGYVYACAIDGAALLGTTYTVTSDVTITVTKKLPNTFVKAGALTKGEYIITMEYGGTTYAMSSEPANAYGGFNAVEVTIEGGSVTSPADHSKLVWTYDNATGYLSQGGKYVASNNGLLILVDTSAGGRDWAYTGYKVQSPSAIDADETYTTISLCQVTNDPVEFLLRNQGSSEALTQTVTLYKAEPSGADVNLSVKLDKTGEYTSAGAPETVTMTVSIDKTLASGFAFVPEVPVGYDVAGVTGTDGEIHGAYYRTGSAAAKTELATVTYTRNGTAVSSTARFGVKSFALTNGLDTVTDGARAVASFTITDAAIATVATANGDALTVASADAGKMTTKAAEDASGVLTITVAPAETDAKAATITLTSEKAYGAGENTFTIASSNDAACVVLVRTADSGYEKVEIKTDGGAHSVTLDSEAEIVVAVAGDASGDGVLDAGDLIAMRGALTGDRPLSAANEAAADISGTGHVGFLDVLAVMQCVLNDDASLAW